MQYYNDDLIKYTNDSKEHPMTTINPTRQLNINISCWIEIKIALPYFVFELEQIKTMGGILHFTFSLYCLSKVLAEDDKG